MPLIDNFIPDPQGFVQSGGVMNSLRGSLPDRNWVRMRQPYLDRHGRACVAINDIKGAWTKNDAHGGEKKPLLRAYLINELAMMGFGTPITANATTLRKEDWIYLQRQVVKTARMRLRFIQDLINAGLTFGGFNAMGKMTIEYQAMSDPGEAVVDMDATTDARNDQPQFILRSMPLPITHSDFGFSDRELQVSRNSDTPLDAVMGEAAARRVAESLEDQGIGNTTGVTYGTQTSGPGTHTGTSTVYGLTNFPQRLTKTNFTAPTTTNGPTTYAEVLAAIEQLQAQFFYGPYTLYHSTNWSQYMNSPFSLAGGNHPSETLRTMLLKHPDIADVRRLDRLSGTVLIFVTMMGDVVQVIDGMDVTVVQWEEKGGLEKRFKVMAIRPIRMFSDYSSQCGILHGTTS